VLCVGKLNNHDSCLHLLQQEGKCSMINACPICLSAGGLNDQVLQYHSIVKMLDNIFFFNIVGRHNCQITDVGSWFIDHG